MRFFSKRLLKYVNQQEKLHRIYELMWMKAFAKVMLISFKYETYKDLEKYLHGDN